jgi:hypothetical protein
MLGTSHDLFGDFSPKAIIAPAASIFIKSIPYPFIPLLSVLHLANK